MLGLRLGLWCMYSETLTEILSRLAEYFQKPLVSTVLANTVCGDGGFPYQQFLLFLFQYIEPGDAHKLEQAELVVIDEAAAIPLPLVKKLMAPCLVFMASTING